MADLRELITQWRHNAQGCGRRDQHAAGTWRSCARELERALAAQPAPAGDVAMPKPEKLYEVYDLRGDSAHILGYTTDQLRAYGDARAAAAGAKVPEGVVRVPKRPTPEMIAAALYALDEEASAEAILEEAWAALLAAAPQPAAVKESLTTAQEQRLRELAAAEQASYVGAGAHGIPDEPQPAAQRNTDDGILGARTVSRPGVTHAYYEEAKATGPVLVDTTFSRHIADGRHGNRYSIDWVYHCDSRGLLSEREAPPTDAPEAKAGADYRHERELLKVIDERDEREEVINETLSLVLGEDRPEWSSTYGFGDAINDVAEKMQELAQPKPAECGAVDLLQTVAVELEARARADERATPGDGDGPATLREWARRLRLIAPAGSGEAVANPFGCVVGEDFFRNEDDAIEHLKQWGPSGATIHPVFTGAAPSARPIGYGDVIDGRLMSYSHEPSERCRTRVYAGAAPADVEALNICRELVKWCDENDQGKSLHFVERARRLSGAEGV